MLLHPERAAAAPVCEHVGGAARLHARESVEHSAYRVDLAARYTIGAMPGGAGTLGFASIWCWPALALCMCFDQGVLGHLGTDRPLRARPTIGAGLHNRDGCMQRMRARESERVGSTYCK